MKLKTKWLKRLLAAGLALSMLFGIPGADAGNRWDLGAVTAEAANTAAVTRQSVHDGAILHAFCWNFNTIREKMPEIAGAGFTAVQTSPINECLSTRPGLQIHGSDGMWYYHYQPTDWVIGNYQLGTRDEFIAMCETAHEYGVAVLVDILPNHTTPTRDQVSQNLLDAAGGSFETLLHKSISDKSGRLGTTYSYDGLLDVDTENPGFQAYFYHFLMDCIACGADGFRIDTAKHIALPDDPVPAEYDDPNRNTFYPNMKAAIDESGVDHSGNKVGYADLFVYGETLQGNERTAAYQEMLGGTTASKYGASIRTALASRDLTVGNLLGYQIGNDGSYVADSNKLVTWVESHDNYCNDGEDSWKVINDTDVRLGWAIIGARADGTPLFFSRPANSSASNPWGDNILGAAGNDEFKSPEVAAVNRFRKTMAGKGEYLSNPNGNIQTLMIERGSELPNTAEGAVIINAGGNDVALDSVTRLADGTYRNMVEGSTGVFTVQGGKLSGVLPARSVVVLSEVSEETSTTVFFYNSENWGSVNAVSGETSYPATSNGDGWYSVALPGSEVSVRFTDGTNSSELFEISAATGYYVTAAGAGIYASKAAAEEAIGVKVVSVYFFNTPNWSTVNAYGWYDDGAQVFGGWPGSEASYDGNFWYRADVKMNELKDFNIIFNGDGAQTADLKIAATSLTPAEDGSLKAYVALNTEQSGGNLSATIYDSMEAPEDLWGVSGSRAFTDVFFYNVDGWDEVAVYTWGATSMGDWPGTVMDSIGDGWYKARVSAAPGANLSIIFNNNNAGQQTADKVLDSIDQRYFVGKGGAKYASMKEAIEAVTGKENEVQGTTTVYYYNNNGWENVRAWAWNDDGQLYDGAWPGPAATDLGNGWWSAEVPRLAEYGFQIIFNNGEGLQTNGAGINATSGVFTSNDVVYPSREALYEALGIEAPEGGDDWEPVLPQPGETEPADPEPAEEVTTTVYYYNNNAWESVKAWAWNTSGQLFEGSWPGPDATDEGEGWWSMDVKHPAGEFSIIFNDGNGAQTNGALIATAEGIYTSNDVVYNSKEALYEALGIEIPAEVEPEEPEPVVEPEEPEEPEDPVVEPEEPEEPEEPVVEPEEPEEPVVEPVKPITPVISDICKEITKTVQKVVAEVFKPSGTVSKIVKTVVNILKPLKKIFGW